MFLIDDFLNAWRGLKHSPAFLALASTVLALGLGATIFAYGVINTTTLKPPPFPNADRLYAVFGAEPTRNLSYKSLPYVDYADISEQQRTFEELAGYYTGTVIVSHDDLPERYVGGFVTWNFMRVLGQKPLLGRDFSATDDLPNAEPVAILSYELWSTRFNEDPDIIGRTARVNARTATIIGVMPRGFAFPANEMLWVPMAVDPAANRRGDLSQENPTELVAIGRLVKGVSAAQAAEDVAAIAARIAKLYPRSNAGFTTQVVPIAAAPIGDANTLIFAMFAAVWLVLLIACANVASLIFVRANFRIYEAGMRVALGARRPRLIVQMLAESLIISLIGVAGGLVFAAFGLHLMDLSMRSMAEWDAPRWWTFSIDLRVTLFAAGAAILAALLSGIVPALRASRPDVMRILRDGGRTGTGMRLSKFTGAMVIVEIALSAALLTGAGLMTRASVMSLQRDYGADVEGFMSARIGLPLAKYPKEEQGRFFTQLVDELRARPGVLAALASTSMPGVGAEDLRFAIDGKSYTTRAEYPVAKFVSLTPGSFDAFQRPLLKGRDFNAGDTLDSPQVVIVNEALVRRYFPHQNPIGQRLMETDDPDRKPITIIGVAPNINHHITWDRGGFAPTLYRPVTQWPWRFMTVAIRTQGDPLTYGKVIRDAVQRLDRDIAPYWVETLREFQEQKRAALQLLSNIFATFAVIAIILAAVGIYGVLAFATGQRNREIGVRRALGAHDRQILGTVMLSAIVQLVVGLALGAILAPVMGRFVSGGLFGLVPDDPVVYGIVFCLLVLASLLASWIPARRALRVQPATALRCE
jgi:putative ABC transport system permease protein